MPTSFFAVPSLSTSVTVGSTVRLASIALLA